jgi:hypothetical protein
MPKKGIPVAGVKSACLELFLVKFAARFRTERTRAAQHLTKGKLLDEDLADRGVRDPRRQRTLGVGPADGATVGIRRSDHDMEPLLRSLIGIGHET